MAENNVTSFTNSINKLLPIDNEESLSSLIRVIARQIKNSTFLFDIEKLELDLSTVTHPKLFPKLIAFFEKVRRNRKQNEIEEEQPTAPPQISKETRKDKKKKKKKIKGKTSPKTKIGSPSKSLPRIEGVPEGLIRKSIKNEEKRKKRQETKTERKATGLPKRAKWNKQRIVIGIYEPSISHSETEEDPIHRK